MAKYMAGGKMRNLGVKKPTMSKQKVRTGQASGGMKKPLAKCSKSGY